MSVMRLRWALRLGGPLRAWEAVRNGKADAIRLIPEEVGAPPPWLQVLRHRYQLTADRIALRWQERDQVRHARYSAAVSAYLAAQRQVLALGEAEVAARGQLTDATARSAVVQVQLNPSGQWYLSGWAYGLAAVTLGILDLPLTFLAFQTFALAPIYTAMLSVLVVIMLTALGHFAGHYARHVRVRAGVLLGAVLALALLFIVALTYLREAALEAFRTDQPGVSPLGGALAFFAIAAVGFLVPALLASHLRLQPDRRPIAAARAAWRRAHRRWQAALRQANRAERALLRAVIRRKAEAEAARRLVTLVQTEARRLMQVYAMANVRNREGHQIPTCLLDAALPTVQISTALSGDLHWTPPLHPYLPRGV